MGFREHLKSEIVILDGGMGTMLQKSGLQVGGLPEALNMESPALIEQIHRQYIEAGSQVLSTNTFGANALKQQGSGYTVEQIITAAVENARRAIGNKDTYIALNIGPLGELLEPMGTLRFTEAYDLFAEQVKVGMEQGVDLILIETMTDLYEAKAAVLAAKEHSNLPVLCSMSFEKDHRTFTGCTITSMVMVLQGLGVDALGVNCSLGPVELEPILKEILSISQVPVLFQPNAGLPSVVDGETVYALSPEEFGLYGRKFAEQGLRILGGCCGTNDEHIRALVRGLKGFVPPNRDISPLCGVCTPTKTVLLDRVRVVGERINPAGQDLLKEALIQGNMDYVVRQAIDQVQAGAEILDINVAVPGIDVPETMVRVIQEIQAVLDVPLQIDATDPEVIEKALRVYNGKAIVNSVNGKETSLETILPLVKKYGAAVIALTLDEEGIPRTAEERYAIAEKIIRRAGEYGIPRDDVYIDCLTLTAASHQEQLRETLKALELVKKRLVVKTVLGVSNVSHGLPNRERLNRTFLAASLYAGLDLPIINPLDAGVMDTIRASSVLWNPDLGAEEYLESRQDVGKEGSRQRFARQDDLGSLISQGLREEAKSVTKKLLTQKPPLEIVNELIIPALDDMGARYERGEVFLPQIIRSAETAKNSFEILKEALHGDGLAQISKGKIILATVKGDVHDIGKNIVKMLLENYNYEVLDLGRDVDPQIVVAEAIKHEIKLIGLSALMTTTVRYMEETIVALKKENPDFVVMVGGAVLSEDYARSIGADHYGRDAKDGVAIARTVLG
jgi:5-methyltetrahydrofolate--homocysteine methyltransferase